MQMEEIHCFCVLSALSIPVAGISNDWLMDIDRSVVPASGINSSSYYPKADKLKLICQSACL